MLNSQNKMNQGTFVFVHEAIMRLLRPHIVVVESLIQVLYKNGRCFAPKENSSKCRFCHASSRRRGHYWLGL